MNLLHRVLCNSGMWKRVVEEKIFPWVFQDVDLGRSVVEIGPGPGLTTDLLRSRVDRLTAVESDHALADKLARRLAGTNVTVVEQDATAMQFPDGSFDGAVCLTMLHHVPSPALQDRLLAEVARVLRPGAVFAGCDTIAHSGFSWTHIFDTRVPVDPKTFPERLRAAGFEDIYLETNERAFRFVAHKPATAVANPASKSWRLS